MMTSYRARATAYPTKMPFDKDSFSENIKEPLFTSDQRLFSFCIVF